MSRPAQLDIGGPPAGFNQVAVVVVGFLLIGVSLGTAILRAIKQRRQLASFGLLTTGTWVLLSLHSFMLLLQSLNIFVFQLYSIQTFWEAMLPMLISAYLAIQIEVFHLFQQKLQFSDKLHWGLHGLVAIILIVAALPYYMVIFIRLGWIEPFDNVYLTKSAYVAILLGFAIFADCFMGVVSLRALLSYMTKASTNHRKLFIEITIGCVVIVCIDVAGIYLGLLDNQSDRDFVYESHLSASIQTLHSVVGIHYLTLVSSLVKRSSRDDDIMDSNLPVSAREGDIPHS